MFIVKTALKYAFSKGKGQRTSSIVIIIGIALGLAALIIISSIMNGLQTAQLDSLRNLESFDVIIEGENLDFDTISSLEDIDFAFEYIETYALIVDKTSGKSASTRVRAYSNNAFESTRMSQSLHFIVANVPYCEENSNSQNGITISYSMLKALSLSLEDNVDLTFLKPGRSAAVVPYSVSMPVNAVYTSSMTEFSSSTAFVSFDWLRSIMGENSIKIGIYSEKSNAVASSLSSLFPNAKVTTWKEYNRALYSALMLEKALMYVFLAFMFLIICVNLKNSTRRLIQNRRQEGAMLRALGCTKNKVNFIFIVQGLLICVMGEVLGISLGLVATNNMQIILDFADSCVRFFTASMTVLGLLQFQTVVFTWEIVFSCLFVFVLAFVFILIGCKKTFKHEIMEVILNATYQ